MKKFITGKKIIAGVLAAAALSLSLCACGSTGTQSESAADSSAAAQSSVAVSSETAEAAGAAKAEQLLLDVKGTYDELFTVITDKQYDQLWLDKCTAVVGEDAAQQSAEMLKKVCAGTIYGEDAAKAYASNPQSAQFDCFFINGVSQITFDGSKISGVDKDGKTVFSHEYKYVQDLTLSGMMDGFLYKTDDADAGKFTYFFLLPDTPSSTYHIEFRYGSDIEALSKYNEGKYAYWLAAGILTDRDDKMIEDVITLFVEENLGGEEAAQSESEAA